MPFSTSNKTERGEYDRYSQQPLQDVRIDARKKGGTGEDTEDRSEAHRPGDPSCWPREVSKVTIGQRAARDCRNRRDEGDCPRKLYVERKGIHQHRNSHLTARYAERGAQSRDDESAREREADADQAGGSSEQRAGDEAERDSSRRVRIDVGRVLWDLGHSRSHLLLMDPGDVNGLTFGDKQSC